MLWNGTRGGPWPLRPASGLWQLAGSCVKVNAGLDQTIFMCFYVFCFTQTAWNIGCAWKKQLVFSIWKTFSFKSCCFLCTGLSCFLPFSFQLTNCSVKDMEGTAGTLISEKLVCCTILFRLYLGTLVMCVFLMFSNWGINIHILFWSWDYIYIYKAYLQAIPFYLLSSDAVASYHNHNSRYIIFRMPLSSLPSLSILKVCLRKKRRY